MADKKKNKKSKYRSRDKTKSVYDAIYDDSIPGFFDKYGQMQLEAVSPRKQDKIDFFKKIGLIKTAKKGGKIKRPKGIKIALRGFGKAMKHGK
jgi:hypothetical protein